MDSEKLKNKAKPMKKRSVQWVREHFEEVLTKLFRFSLSVVFTSGFLLRDMMTEPSGPILPR